MNAPWIVERMHFVGLRPRDDEVSDAGGGQHVLEVGVLERVAVPLVHDGLRNALVQLGHALPRLAAQGQVVAAVLDPDADRGAAITGLLDQRGHVADHGVAVVRLPHDAVLHVDDEERGVRPTREGAHAPTLEEATDNLVSER